MMSLTPSIKHSKKERKNLVLIIIKIEKNNETIALTKKEQDEKLKNKEN